MPTKTNKKETKGSDWKNLVQGFVGNLLEQISDNVNQRVQIWIQMAKRKTIGFFLSVFGLFYLLIGLSIYVNSVLGKVLPGFGYVAVGVLAILVGYLISNNDTK